MSNYIIQGETLTNIADAIRAKTDTTDTILPSEMVGLIEAISTGTELPPWISEIEFVQATPSISTELSAPCGLSGDPEFIMVLRSESGTNTGYRILYTSAVYTRGYGSALAVSSASNKASSVNYPSVTAENGNIILSRVTWSSSYFIWDTSATYNIIWGRF